MTQSTRPSVGVHCEGPRSSFLTHVYSVVVHFISSSNIREPKTIYNTSLTHFPFNKKPMIPLFHIKSNEHVGSFFVGAKAFGRKIRQKAFRFRLILSASILLLLLAITAIQIIKIPWLRRKSPFFNARSYLQQSIDYIDETYHPYNYAKTQDSLSEYVQWHKSQKACIRNRSCGEDEPKILLWRCPNINKGLCAGVGDRFRGLQFAFLLAVVTKRLFIIDWPKEPFPLLTAVQPASFDWTLRGDISGDSWPEIFWFSCVRPRPCTAAGHLPSDYHLPGPGNSGPDINLESSDLRSVLSNSPKLAIVTRATEESFERLRRNEIAMSDFPDLLPSSIPAQTLQRQIFRLLFRTSAIARESMKKIFPPSYHELGYISVHARTGYDVGESREARFLDINRHPNSFSARLLDCALQTNSDLYKRIFLASDSSKFKTAFVNQAKVRGVEVVHSRVRGFHFGVQTRSSANMKYPEALSAFINVFADFFGLAQAKVILTNGSGFARMAYLYGNASAWRILSQDARCKPMLEEF